MSSPAHVPYQTFLLRCWHSAPPADAPSWRFSLVDVQSGGRRGFADFDALVAYLREQMEAGSASSSESGLSLPPG
jgi:hypothetical protein